MNALGTFGNLGRSTLTGPGVFTIDFSALKNFHFGASNYLQLRIEAFNLLNTPRLRGSEHERRAEQLERNGGQQHPHSRRRRVRHDQFDQRHCADAPAAVCTEVPCSSALLITALTPGALYSDAEALSRRGMHGPDRRILCVLRQRALREASTSWAAQRPTQREQHSRIQEHPELLLYSAVLFSLRAVARRRWVLCVSDQMKGPSPNRATGVA